MGFSSSKEGSQLLTGAFRTFLAEALIIPTGILTTFFLAHYLSPAGYGVFTLAATLVVWIELTISSIFSRAVIRFVSEADDWRPVGTTVLRLYLAAGIGSAVLIWIFAGLVGRVFDEPSLPVYLRLFAIEIPVFTLTQAHRHILLALGKFKLQALASGVRWITRLVFIVILLTVGLSIRGAILGSVASALVALIVSCFYSRPSITRSSGFPVGRFWTYAGPLLILGLGLRLFDKLDLYMLKALGGSASDAGFFAAAQNLSLIPGFLALSFSPLLLSTLARLLREGNHILASSISRDAMRLSLWLLPFAGLAAGTSVEVVKAIYGVEFLPAAPLFSLLIFGAVALVVNSVGIIIVIAAGKLKWALMLSAPLPFVAIGGHLLMIPRSGMKGAATVTLSASTLAAAATMVLVSRCGTVFPFATLCRCILVGGIAFSLAELLSATAGPFFFLLKLAVIGVLIPLALWVLGEFSADEIAFTRSHLWRRTAASRSAPGEV